MTLTPMTSELRQFARQLALWTELIIENGRTPFRRVDLYPELYTDRGVLQPPLVFWINRQSMMAGGILLLPKHELGTDLQYGRSCCDALGLKHFVTWESEQVRIWQVDADDIREHQQFDLLQNDHPDAFRQLLADILEALKLLAVIGLVPKDQLSPHYLHNLFQTTLQLALPPLVNSYRSRRAEDEVSPVEDADQLATDANRLLLLQLLSLAWHRQLPEAILPEKLERAIQLSLPQLPEQLRTELAATVTANPPALPYETAVCFHHLLLRLRQLSWQQPAERAVESMLLLINSWGKASRHCAAEVQLYPQSPQVNSGSRLILSTSPSLLAAIRILEDLQQQQPKELLLGNIFQCDIAGKLQQQSLCGQLCNQRLLAKAERQQYTALLRTSWPNRRLRIGGDKPLWFWELIHLLGLGKRLEKLVLTLPRSAVLGHTDELFWQLLWENFTIRRLAALPDEQIELELIPGAQEATLTIELAEETRQISAAETLNRFRNQLVLTLQLPHELYRLLDDKLIWPETEADIQASSGLQIYLQTDFCRQLAQLLGYNLQNMSAAERDQALLNLPLPDQLHLHELARAATSSPRQETAPDQLLADVLESAKLTTVSSAGSPPSRTTSAASSAEKGLRDELVKQLQTAGIPNFPEQYLYFLDHPETTSYSWIPPLRMTNEFLGEIELADAGGHIFNIYGKDLADALLLCSTLGKSEVELPDDRDQLELILQQYWADLNQLNKQLKSLAHSRLKSSTAATRLVKKVWKKLRLPKLKA